MTNDLALPDFASDDARFRRAVQVLRDHLLGAVEVDMAIRLNGRAYAIAWADRQPAETDETMFSLAAGMRVMERRGRSPAEVVPSGEEQMTIVVDGERFIFHLMEVEAASAEAHRPKQLR